MKNRSDKPSLVSFVDALHKGFGRAFLWTKSGYANAPQLIDACLNDYRFDRQVEDARGDWLWRIAKASAIYDTLKDSVLDALDNISNSDAECQLCQLAAHFAEEGDDRFRMRLREIVRDKPVEEMQWLGEKELMQLDGDDGFLLALRRHAADLRTREWDWFDATLVDEAREILGEQHISDVLGAICATNEDIRPFVEFLRRERSQKSEAGSAAHMRELESLTVEDVIAAAESPEKSARFRGWGRKATSLDLERVLERLLNCDNVLTIQRYLQVFAARPLPRFDNRILDLCQHENLQVRRRAATAVANNEHSEIRKFAISKLAHPEYQECAIDILATNYERGDEHRILKVLELPDDECERHWLLMNLLNLIEKRPEAESLAAAQLIYEETPCSQCRYSVVKLMGERSAVPEPLRAECQYDVVAETRSLVGCPSWSGLAE